MASGLPAIVSDQVGCAPDLVIPEKTGMVFRCGDVNELASHCRNLSRNEKKIEEMGSAARRLIENYSIGKAVEGTLKAIYSIERRTGRVAHLEGSQQDQKASWFDSQDEYQEAQK